MTGVHGESVTMTLSEASKRPSASEQQAFLFVVLRADQPLAPSSRHALGDLDIVQLRRGVVQATARVVDENLRHLVLTIPDRGMSSNHAALRRREDGWWLEDLGSKNGTMVDGKRVTAAALRDGALLEVGHTLLLFRNSLPSPEGTQPDVTALELSAPSPLLATLAPGLGRTFTLLAEVAKSSIPVLIGGESGTGKEVVARAVHEISRRTGNFVAINCGALPATLMEAELFGFRKGAFSGALEDRAGLVRSAHGGSLFLDEIGDLPLAAQAALLRVLQEHEVLPIGAVKAVSVDLRVLSATHKSLDDLVQGSSFRGDLMSRLAGFRVMLPPLRERREDLGLLVARVLTKADVATDSVVFSSNSARTLLTHTWPGNVRELEHRLRLGIVLAKGGVVEAEHLFNPDAEPVVLDARSDAMPHSAPTRPLTPEDEARRDALALLLTEHRGNVTAVARAMGKDRVQIQRWIKRYGLERNHRGR